MHCCITLLVLNHWKKRKLFIYLYYVKPQEEQIQPRLYLLLCKQIQFVLDWIAQEGSIIRFWELISSMSCLSSGMKSVAGLELQAELLLPGKPRPDHPGGGCLWSVQDKQRAVKRFLRRNHRGLLGQCFLGAWNLLPLMFLERENGQRCFLWAGFAAWPIFFWKQLIVITDSQICSNFWTNIWILETRNKLAFIKTLWACYSMSSPEDACADPSWKQAPGRDLHAGLGWRCLPLCGLMTAALSYEYLIIFSMSPHCLVRQHSDVSPFQEKVTGRIWSYS